MPVAAAGICMVRVLFSVPVLVILTAPVVRVAGELGDTPLTLTMTAQTFPVWLSNPTAPTEVQLVVPTVLVWPTVPAATVLPAFSL